VLRTGNSLFAGLLQNIDAGENTEGGDEMKRTLMVLASILFFVMGCVQEPSEELSDSDNIQELIEGSSLVRMSPLDGQGESGGKDSAVHPEYWWRELDTEGDLDVLLENDPAAGICTVTVTRTLHADFNIDVVHDGVLDPGVKEINDVRTRRLIVERTGEESDPHGGWQLTHITPAQFQLNSGLEQEVFVISMSLYSGDELLWECDSPDTFYSVEDGLPVLVPGEMVRVEAEVLHTAPSYDPPLFVFVHGPCPVWPRHWMNDQGLWGDRIAGDGIYSYEWYVEASSEHWFVAVDVIDADTMMDQEEEDYDSGAWGILALDS
jgi:hypothetical protein